MSEGQFDRGWDMKCYFKTSEVGTTTKKGGLGMRLGGLDETEDWV